MSRKFVAAVVQAAPVWLDKAGTTAKAIRLIREAAALGARVCAFPESFIPAFPYGAWHHDVQKNIRFLHALTESAVDLADPDVSAIRAAARETRCVVVMGLTERAGGRLFDTQLFVGADGSMLGTRRKLKLKNAERVFWSNGSGLRVFDTGETGRLGGLISSEHDSAATRSSLQSQQEQVHVASYPDPFAEGRPFADRIDAALRHYAVEGQCFVLNASGFMSSDVLSRVYDTPELAAEVEDPDAIQGGSSIIAPDGRYLAGPLVGREGLLAAELDLREAVAPESWFNPSGYPGRPDVFGDMSYKPRCLGHRVQVPDVVRLDDDGLRDLLREIWRHGVVCVPRQQLSAENLVRLSRRFGEPVVLPPCFFDGMRDPDYPQVCRVGNLRPGSESVRDADIRPDSVIRDAKFGEYWHHDGNFYAAPRNAIVNALYAKVVPDVGGDTHFLDSTGALRAGHFGLDTEEQLRHTTITVSHEWISDFKNASPADIEPMGMPHLHDAVQTHPVTKKDCLYLPLDPSGLKDERTGRHWTSSQDVWDRLQAAGFSYTHQWQPGDLLLWDNLQVLHRSGGGFGDRPRLLLRTQTMYAEGPLHF